MSKHTPGEWKSDNGLIINPDGLRVADMICEDQPGISLEETEANALLIAASPDMLEALEAAGDCICYEDLRVVYSDLIAPAIAKAKGETDA